MTIAMKKDGALMPAMLLTIAVLSIQLFFLKAAIMPREMPTIIAKSIAQQVRIIVPGSASE